MYRDGCTEDRPQFLSPTANFANRMLTGDWSRGEYGLLIRTVDYFDESTEGIKEIIERHGIEPPDPIPPIQHLPSSFLHSSIRAPGAIYQNIVDKEFNQGDFALLYGTRFSKNTIFKEFQEKEMDCEFIYPHDAATIDRGTVFDKTMCNDIAKDHAICVPGGGEGDEEKCIAHGPGACGGCKVDAAEFGDLVGQWAESHEKLSNFFYTSCFYDTIEGAVTSSNSLWRERERWYDQAGYHDSYQGYNECATSLSIKDAPADAVVLTIHRTMSGDPQNVCHFPNHVWLDDRLRDAFAKGHGDLPVLFYRESLGIHTVQDCQRILKGVGCEDAYHKEFFSQEYQFDTGACLHRPKGCDEVYYFPAEATGDGEEKVCSATTKAGRDRIKKLCERGYEQKQDARVAYDEILNKIGQTPVVHATSKEGRPFSAEKPLELFKNSTTNMLLSTPDTLPRNTMRGGGTRQHQHYSAPKPPTTTFVHESPAGFAWVNHFVFLIMGLVVALFLQRKLVITRVDS